MTIAAAFSIMVISSPATPAMAQENQPETLPRPVIFQELVDCRSIEDPDKRLACYDEKVGELDTAQKNEDIVITDREAVKKTKRGLFGFSLPKLKIFGKEGNEQLSQLTSTIKSVRTTSRGKWVIILEDGAVWTQIDRKRNARNPKPGMTVVIKKASMGSYFVKVDGQTALRMKRTDR